MLPVGFSSNHYPTLLYVESYRYRRRVHRARAVVVFVHSSLSVIRVGALLFILPRSNEVNFWKSSVKHSKSRLYVDRRLHLLFKLLEPSLVLCSILLSRSTVYSATTYPRLFHSQYLSTNESRGQYTATCPILNYTTIVRYAQSGLHIGHRSNRKVLTVTWPSGITLSIPSADFTRNIMWLYIIHYTFL